MHPFLMALAGGALVGLSASLLLLFNGQVAGISGITGGVLSRYTRAELAWRLTFLAGLLGGGFLVQFLSPQALGVPSAPGAAWMVAAGLLVGFGTRLGNGCTSGHGVCGLSRLSLRSAVAVATFMASGAITTWIAKGLA